MNIVGVMAYTAGTTHTYIAKEKLEQVARKLEYTYRIETRGNTRIEEQLTPGEVGVADVIILIIDMKTSGEGRFKGKPVVRMSTEKVMKNTGALFQSTGEALTKKKNGGD